MQQVKPKKKSAVVLDAILSLGAFVLDCLIAGKERRKAY